jgi:hypothetical protein
MGVIYSVAPDHNDILELLFSSIGGRTLMQLRRESDCRETLTSINYSNNKRIHYVSHDVFVLYVVAQVVYKYSLTMGDIVSPSDKSSQFELSSIIP